MEVAEKKKHCCLFRLNCLPGQEHAYVILDDKDIVSLGRSNECSVILTESPAISRLHALLEKQTNDQWSITDCRSGNGIYVNNTKLVRDVGHILQDREVVEIGRDANNTQSTYYRFQYFIKATFVHQKETSNIPGNSMAINNNHGVGHKVGLSPTALLENKIDQQKKLLEQELSAKKAEEEEKHLLMAELSAMKEEMKTAEQSRFLCEKKLTEIEETYEARETELTCVLLDKQAELKKSQEEQKTEKQQLKEAMEKEVERFKQEKLEMVQTLKTCNSQEIVLCEAVRELESRQAEVVGQLKLAEQKADNNEKSKTEFVSSLEQMVESELICSICSEMFIQATSLGCSHSFCHLCIMKWMSLKKECPNCRKCVTYSVRSLALDNYIEKLMEILSDDMRSERQATLLQRQRDQTLWDEQQVARRQAQVQQAQVQRAQGQRAHGQRAHGHRAQVQQTQDPQVYSRARMTQHIPLMNAQQTFQSYNHHGHEHRRQEQTTHYGYLNDQQNWAHSQNPENHNFSRPRWNYSNSH